MPFLVQRHRPLGQQIDYSLLPVFVILIGVAVGGFLHACPAGHTAVSVVASAPAHPCLLTVLSSPLGSPTASAHKLKQIFRRVKLTRPLSLPQPKLAGYCQTLATRLSPRGPEDPHGSSPLSLPLLV